MRLLLLTAVLLQDAQGRRRGEHTHKNGGGSSTSSISVANDEWWLMDASSDLSLGRVFDGTSIQVDVLLENVNIEYRPVESVDEVRFYLNSQFTRTERQSPYLNCGNLKENVLKCTKKANKFQDGELATVRVELWRYTRASNNKKNRRRLQKVGQNTIELTVTTTIRTEIDTLHLWNVDTDQAIAQIDTTTTQINLDLSDTALSIKATLLDNGATAATSSIHWTLYKISPDGSLSTIVDRFENRRPYFLLGDSRRGKPFTTNSFTPGFTYTLQVQPFDESHGHGTPGALSEFHFSLTTTGQIELPTTAPTIAPTSPKPTTAPTLAPTSPKPTTAPTIAPTSPKPTTAPTTATPTAVPSALPTITARPTAVPSALPTITAKPTAEPSASPTTMTPTDAPTTPAPTLQPTITPINRGEFTQNEVIELSLVSDLSFVAIDPGIIEGFRRDRKLLLRGNTKRKLLVTGTVEENPFLDYKLIVTFVGPQGEHLDVNGYYAGNSIWKVLFIAPSVGSWKYFTSFVRGDAVAIEILGQCELGNSAESAGYPDDEVGTFEVLESVATLPDLGARGMLYGAEERYMRFALDDSSYIMNSFRLDQSGFLSYSGFNGMDTLAEYSFGAYSSAAAPSEQLASIFGAIEYLSANGITALYLSTAKANVFPWLDASSSILTFDVVRLEQWRAVLEYCNALGIVVYMEVLATGAIERAGLLLYYRELIARFGHLNGLVFVFDDDNDADGIVTQTSEYIRYFDPYMHPISVTGMKVSSVESQQDSTDASALDIISIDYSSSALNAGTNPVAAILAASASVFRYAVTVFNTEPDETTFRAHYLWSSLVQGSAGFELLGSSDDLSTVSSLLQFSSIATAFFDAHLPFTQMTNQDHLVSSVVTVNLFAQQGSTYLLHFPYGLSEAVSEIVTINLDLSAEEPESTLFSLYVFDPSSGSLNREDIDIPGGAEVEISSSALHSLEDTTTDFLLLLVIQLS